MRLRRRHTNIETPGDFLVAEAITDHLENLDFARGRNRAQIVASIPVSHPRYRAQPLEQACRDSGRTGLLTAHNIGKKWREIA
jgi:hypothetical protein